MGHDLVEKKPLVWRHTQNFTLKNSRTLAEMLEEGRVGFRTVGELLPHTWTARPGNPVAFSYARLCGGQEKGMYDRDVRNLVPQGCSSTSTIWEVFTIALAHPKGPGGPLCADSGKGNIFPAEDATFFLRWDAELDAGQWRLRVLYPDAGFRWGNDNSVFFPRSS